MHRPRIRLAAVAAALLLSLCHGVAAAGTIVTIPIDLGAPEFEVSAVSRLERAFDGGQPWSAVEDVRLRLVGRHTCQYVSCAENPSYQAAPTDAAVDFGFLVDGAEILRTELGFPCVVDGADFDLTLSFESSEEPDWSFLAAGTGTLFVDHLPTPDSCVMFPTFVGIDAVLTAAELLVELPTGVHQEEWTWSTVKVRYR